MAISVLNGLKVLDFSRILAAPYCAQLLGDHGATVWKIERPGTGDEVRRWHPPEIHGQSCYFVAVNRNKKSVALNLGHADGRRLARRLAERADVLLENFKSEQMERFGLGYEQLAEVNPRLVYCSITGKSSLPSSLFFRYGSTGPYAQDPGYDVIAEAVGGFMSITGPQSGEPCKAGTAIIDLLTGVHSFSGILMALLARGQNGGRGQRVECNLLATQIAALANMASNYLNAGVVGRKWGTAHESIVPYQAFRTKDGRFYVVGAADNSSFVHLCELLELPIVAEDPEFATNAKRVENRERLLRILSDKFATEDLEFWKAKLRNRRFPSGPVHNIAEAFDHEQVRHLGLVQEVEHPAYGRNTVKYSEIRNEVRSAPPLLGEHTAEVLKEELDIDERKLREYEQSGAIGLC
ncbi:Succinate--hydroxymethylglutarate CoA-transferase [Aphelenchoides fujianensis]|nr:Succinate--hydroxymethylglutarate CoA-transferase [Aphelenchoides fujianensis]